MDVFEVGQVVVLMVAPTSVIGAALFCPRAIRAVRRLVPARVEVDEPSGAPIEQLASDLRRLLQRHGMLKLSPGIAQRAHHLAVEAAISDCATEAARALGVPYRDPPRRRPLSIPELRVLLGSLAAAGLVLSPATGLFAADGGF
jgi:hypothetical protein